MPRYFFNILSPDVVLLDDVGIDLADLDEVRFEAVKGARSIMADDLRAGRPVDHQRFEVVDESGVLVLAFAFRDVLTLPPDGSVNGVSEIS